MKIFFVLFVHLGAAAAQCLANGMMSQVVVTKFNAADPISTLDTVLVPIPVPGPNEVLVHMRACPIHPADFFSVMGVYPSFAPPSLPATPGLEGMGVIARAGGAAGSRLGTIAALKERGLDVGSRVVPLHWTELSKGNGTFSEYLVVRVDDLVKVPDSLPDEAASQVLLNPLTALGMLESLGAVPRGSLVLQSAGGSTLGKQLIQIAKAKGLRTISTVRRCEQTGELLTGYGADFVVSRTRTNTNPRDTKAVAVGRSGCACSVQKDFAVSGLMVSKVYVSSGYGYFL
jgi:NADPH:quinone reductase-like Zn-dependent oxidoreductase